MMYVCDVVCKEFYEFFGLDVCIYDKMVIEKINEMFVCVFFVVFDVNNDKFWICFECLVFNNVVLDKVDVSDIIVFLKLFCKLFFWIGNGVEMVKLFLMFVIDSDCF